MNVANLYLPPASSLARRDIPEAHAAAQVEHVLEQLQPQLLTLVCGDFNAPIGTLTPSLDIPHPIRETSNNYICPRAKWFIT